MNQEADSSDDQREQDRQLIELIGDVYREVTRCNPRVEIDNNGTVFRSTSREPEKDVNRRNEAGKNCPTGNASNDLFVVDPPPKESNDDESHQGEQWNEGCVVHPISGAIVSKSSFSTSIST